MQLRKISITEGLIEYEVVFIGKLIDIFGVWGDQQLNGRDDEGNRIIDLSDLNHTLTESNQSAVFAPKTPEVVAIIPEAATQDTGDQGTSLWVALGALIFTMLVLWGLKSRRV
jgi:LPXTG-motif cell wall-anchored protein